jgi:hypothetical protein
MPRNQDASDLEPIDGHDRQPSDRERGPDHREPPDGDDRIGRAHPPRDDGDDENGHDGVTRRPSRLPASEREAEAEAEAETETHGEDDRRYGEEFADAELLDVLDLDELEPMEWPDV